MCGADLYVQNSTFETFGLSALEALANGCDILISKRMGICEVIDGLETCDIICDVTDTEEIYDKMVGLLDKGNAKRLIKTIRWELVGKEFVSDWFYKEFRSQIKNNYEY